MAACTSLSDNPLHEHIIIWSPPSILLHPCDANDNDILSQLNSLLSFSKAFQNDSEMGMKKFRFHRKQKVIHDTTMEYLYHSPDIPGDKGELVAEYTKLKKNHLYDIRNILLRLDRHTEFLFQGSNKTLPVRTIIQGPEHSRKASQSSIEE
ncbi:hypothetical protein [Bombella apis]|uniref:hypothetical protein n=1 Tax=Bombella apis TaxID=1785988 RepID=UPI0023F53AD2|nr:hypothetical protein [Bombella apis]